MNIQIEIADLIFQFILPDGEKWTIDAPLLNYIVKKKHADIFITVSSNWENTKIYSNKKKVGHDLLHEFYEFNSEKICTVKGGLMKACALCVYGDDYSNIICYLNKLDFKEPPHNIAWLLQTLPIMDILQAYNRQLFHASEIYLKKDKKGIVFAGHSGVGKTTQSKLWEEFQRAEIICNDRVVLRKSNDSWKTYGFPMDGSEPVYSNKDCELGAIILLKQGIENKIIALNSAEKLKMLMQQCVIEAWSIEANTKALFTMTDLLESVRIFCYSCTATKEAVLELKKILLEQGVIQS